MKRKYEIAVLSKGGFARTVRIYAPKKADRAIIMHDGQNVFYDEDATYKKSWRALDAFKAAGIKNTAIIGIDSTATRDYDYMPFPSELDEYGIPTTGGKADAYMEYLEEIIIPYLDKRFGFKFYGMLGSSNGGLATLYFAARKNARVKAYGLFSTPLFVSPKAFAEFFKTATFDADAYYKVYVGGNEITTDKPELMKIEEQSFVTDSYVITDELRKSGVVDLDLTVTNVAKHDELAWRAPAREFYKKFSLL
ncbi:MAG: hypothetical protein K2F90_05185 [Clostridiales bacterium]|nr:hypothetical protein [Clostridiales bacterium]